MKLIAKPCKKHYRLLGTIALLCFICASASSQSCNASLGDPIVNFTFGAGPDFGPPLGSSMNSMQYIANSCPNDGFYSITSYSTNCYNNSWYTITDHTGDANGRYMLVNASYQPSDFYVQQVDGLCSGTTYQFSAWVMNVYRNTSGIRPNITFQIERPDGTVLQSYNTGDMPGGTPVWNQYGLFFTTPAGVNSVIVRMRNNAPGGIGNDLALDDIAFRPAGPSTKISINGQGDSTNVCNATVQLTSIIESCYLSNEFQWQLSVNNGTWRNIPGANNDSYTVPVLAPGKYQYRLLVSQAGNIQTTSCRVNSNVATVVVVPSPNIQAVGAVICSGQNYTLPSGRIVSASGNYKDTARYSFGCDSLITNLQLSVQSPIFVNTNISICQGEIFTFPSGAVASVSGIYHDTVRYSSGCDSLISKINLLVKPVATVRSSINICAGQSTTLPWGAVVSAPGVYSDTLRYVSGCDSVIRNVLVHVTRPVLQNIYELICPGEIYTLPSGTRVSTPGTYNDTLRTPIGCDSIITFLTLGPAQPPVIQVFKSNDVNCTLGISKLRATGGVAYLWSPAETLDNPAVFNPIATPVTPTVYKVLVTTKDGCVGEDSIAVNVSSDPKNLILIPDAFTPNGDGLNDLFGLKHMGQITDLKFSIYNRWGNRVFYTTDPSKSWDGRSGGAELKSDVFVYQVSATTLCGKIFRTGTIALIR